MSRRHQVRSEAAYSLYFPNNGGVVNPTLAYGYLTVFAPATIAASSIVDFNPPGIAAGITTSNAGFTIISAGTYMFDYRVEGSPQTRTSQLLFELIRNGIAVVPLSQFESDAFIGSSVPLEEVVSGTGILQAGVGDVISLKNITNGGTDSVTISGVLDVTVYVAFRLIRIAGL